MHNSNAVFFFFFTHLMYNLYIKEITKVNNIEIKRLKRKREYIKDTKKIMIEISIMKTWRKVNVKNFYFSLKNKFIKLIELEL